MTGGGVGAEVDLEREDGRTLRVRAVGADDGPVVVYLHGAPSSRLDIDDLHERSRDRGVRVVSFDRPGYGGSSFARFDYASIADDVAAVADHVGAAAVPVVGQSAGASYALGAAAYQPQRVAAIVVAGGGAPFAPAVPGWDRLSVDEQRGVQLIGVDDAEAERLLAEADRPFLDILAADDEGLLDFWREHCSPADQRLVDERFGPLLVRTVRESLRQGQAGWACDNVARMGPWPFDPGAITCPTAVWFGEQDGWQSGAWIVEQIPHATLHVGKDRGHFALFEEWDQVLDFCLRAGAAPQA